MKTLNVWYHCTFFIFTCCLSLCGTLITSSPRVRINQTDEILIPAKVEVVLDNKTVLTRENVELVCEVKPKSAALAITWTKKNEIISQSDRVKIKEHKIFINRTRASDGGYYTCSVKTSVGIQSKTAVLTVTELDEEDDDDFSGEEFPCGRPDEREISECVGSYGFSNCKSFAPAVNVNDIKITKTLQNKNLRYSTYRLDIQWKVPKAGNSDIWGWQITIAEKSAHAGPSLCRQVNKKYIWESKNGDLYMKFAFLDIHLGTTIELTIQSLPAMDMTKSVVKKTILPKGFCEIATESPCCYEAKNVVIKQMDKTSVMLSWPDLTNSSINSTMLSGFDVTYNSTYPNYSCHQGFFTTSVKDALKTSYIIVQNLRPRCQNYSVKVRPVFTNNSCNKCPYTCDRSHKRGKYSKFYFFRMAMNESSDVYYIRKHYLNNLFKALLIVVALLVFSICLFVVIVIRKKKRALEKSNQPGTISKARPVTEIFIAHGSHCRDCEDVVLSVATYFNMTGYCKSFLDLCSLPEEWSRGMTQYYENQIAKRQKVIILFTVNESEECKENIKGRNFIYQKNLIRSELFANCPTTKFIPVYMDFLSDLDIPCFLRNKKSFSLPSQLNELMLYIVGEALCKPVSVCSMLSVDEDSNLLKQKKILEAKIKDLNAKHQKKLKIKNNNLIAKIV